MEPRGEVRRGGKSVQMISHLIPVKVPLTWSEWPAHTAHSLEEMRHERRNYL